MKPKSRLGSELEDYSVKAARVTPTDALAGSQGLFLSRILTL